MPIGSSPRVEHSQAHRGSYLDPDAGRVTLELRGSPMAGLADLRPDGRRLTSSLG